MYNGATALLIAAQHGQTKIVQALLRIDAVDCNQHRNDGATPLMMAAYRGDVEAVSALLDREDIDLNKTMHHGITALFLAAQSGHRHVVERLLMHDDINITVAYKTTPKALVRFARKYTTADNPVEQRMLAYIKRQADQQDIAITPIQIAAIMGHEEIVQALKNNNLLHRAVENARLDIVQALIDTVDVNHIIYNGGTALFIAAQNGEQAIVEALIRAGADVNHRMNNGHAPLLYAVYNGHLAVVEALIKAGANVDQLDVMGFSALMYAIHYDHLDIVKTLINAGANINQRNAYHSTPLYIATKKANIDMVIAVLTAADIDPNLGCQKKAVFI